jgi:hypothetical protein
VVASYQRPSSPSLLLPQLQRLYWICRPAAILLHIPSPTSSSFLQELQVRGPAAVAMATRAMCFFCFMGVKSETRLRAHLRLQCNPRSGIEDVRQACLAFQLRRISAKVFSPSGWCSIGVCCTLQVACQRCANI